MPTFRRRPRFALSLVALSASTVAAQAPLWSAAPLGTAADWGTRLDTLGDLDSDGVTDVLAVSGGDQRYEVRSGATGALLRSGGAVNSCPGIRAVALGDLNGDGLREVGIAVLPGLLSVVDARTGSQLRLEVPPALTQIRSMWVAVVGDVDADGIEDHIVSFSQDMRDAQGTFVNGGPGYSELRSGATGARLHIGPSNDFIFGLGGYCAGIGDVTGDGKPDYVVGSDISGAQQANPGQLGFFVVSGATGIAVNVISTTSYGGGLMLRAVGVGDVNGDGRGEFVVASPDSGTLTLFGGSVFFPVLATRPLDGHGASYFPAARATWEALEASTLLDVTDIDNDGVRELWVGSPMPRLPLPTGGHSVLGPGQVALYSGRTLERMGFIPGTGWNESFGSGIADLGDVNGDGRGDVLVGVPLPHFGTNALRAFSGRPASGQPYNTCVGSYRTQFGTRPVIGHSGSPSTQTSPFRLTLHVAEPSSFAFLQASPTLTHRIIGQNVAGPLTVCLGTPFVRASGVVLTDPLGAAATLVPVGPGTPFLAGDTWAFQWAFRSSFAPYELSDVLVATFVP